MTETLTTRPSFSALRHAAETDPVTRACIGLRAQEIAFRGWDVRQSGKDRDDFTERRAAAMQRCRRPDPNYAGLSSWLRAVLDWSLTFDAVALLPVPTRKGNPDSVWLLDGRHILPWPSASGKIIGFAGYLHEVSRASTAAIRAVGLGDPDILYGPAQIRYLVFRPVPGSPFGRSPVEESLGKGDEEVLRAFGIAPSRIGMTCDGVSPEEDAAWLGERLDWLAWHVMPLVIADDALRWEWAGA